MRGMVFVLATVVALSSPMPAVAQEHDYDGVEGFFQPQPQNAIWHIAAIGTNAVAFNHTMYIGRSYNMHTFIDGKQLSCTHGTSLNNGCYHWFTATASMIHSGQMHLAQSRGEATTSGGGTFRARYRTQDKTPPSSQWVFDFEFTHDFYVPSAQANGCQVYACTGSPIVVPLDKSPEVKFSEPRVVFDLDGDGSPEVISWPINGGFLVHDRDGDGQITSGKELYGNFTFSGISNGFDALAHEGKGNAVVDKDNPLFTKVKVWVDEDQDGLTDPGELRPLSDYVQRLFLFYELSGKKDKHGNTYQLKGEAVYADGEQRPIYDVYLARAQ